MANAPIELGPVGERVAENVKRLRAARNLDLADLSLRLGELGRPIGVPALSRIENGQRRIDASDLVALAVALRVTPNALMFGTETFLGPRELTLTPKFSVDLQRVWSWADGEFPIEPATAREQLDFQRQARPHLPPVIHKDLPTAVRNAEVSKALEDAYKAAAKYFERDLTVLDLLMGELRRELPQPFDFDKWFGPDGMLDGEGSDDA